MYHETHQSWSKAHTSILVLILLRRKIDALPNVLISVLTDEPRNGRACRREIHEKGNDR